MTDRDTGAGLLKTASSPLQPSLRTGRRFAVKNLGEVLALVGLITVFTALNPTTFLTPSNLQTILDQASLPLIIGVGATMVILMGSIDLSVEGVMGAAGMTFVLMSANSRGSDGFGPWAIVAALGVGIGLGLMNGLIHTRLKVPSFIVTLGVWFVGLGLATVLFGDEAIPFLPDGGIKGWPSTMTFGLPNSFLLSVVFVLVGAFMMHFTRLGRFSYAIGDSEEISKGNGIPVLRYKLYVFLVAGACSAVAGVLASLQLGAGAATIGGGTLFVTIAAVVIGGTSLGGGKGGILRTAIGVLMLTVLNNGLILSGVSPNIQSAVSGTVLIAAVLVATWPHRSRLRIVK